MARKTRKHKQYTIEEKNEIVKEYLSGESGGIQRIGKTYDASNSMVERWIAQYLEFGTCVDRRGLASKGRSYKQSKDYEAMSKKDLIEHIKMVDDIKKVTAYLRKQKKNIK